VQVVQPLSSHESHAAGAGASYGGDRRASASSGTAETGCVSSRTTGSDSHSAGGTRIVPSSDELARALLGS